MHFCQTILPNSTGPVRLCTRNFKQRHKQTHTRCLLTAPTRGDMGSADTITFKLGTQCNLICSQNQQLESNVHKLFLCQACSPMYLWILVPKVLGSSRLKPEVSRAVSCNNNTRSLTVLSLLSASARLRSSCSNSKEGQAKTDSDLARKQQP